MNETDANSRRQGYDSRGFIRRGISEHAGSIQSSEITLRSLLEQATHAQKDATTSLKACPVNLDSKQPNIVQSRYSKE